VELEFFKSVLGNPEYLTQGALVALFYYGVRVVIPKLLAEGIVALKEQRQADRDARTDERKEFRENLTRIIAGYDRMADKLGSLTEQIARLAECIRQLEVTRERKETLHGAHDR
jgi:DNA repair exonuclease SbcCD ATPase subunit